VSVLRLAVCKAVGSTAPICALQVYVPTLAVYKGYSVGGLPALVKGTVGLDGGITLPKRYDNRLYHPVSGSLKRRCHKVPI